MSSIEPKTDALRPMTEIQIEQTREFVDSLNAECQTYWDMVEIGDELSRDLHITPELVILYADAVEDFNPWYEGWLMNTWHRQGESPFGPAIVPPLMMSHFVLSVQFDHTKPFAIGSIHTFHDSEIIEPIPVGATVKILAKAIDKFVKRERRYVRHEVTVTDVGSGKLYFKEIRDNHVSLRQGNSKMEIIEEIAVAKGLFRWENGKADLIGSRCNGCGTHYFPMGLSCRNPNCREKLVEEVLLSRRGTLYSYAIQSYRPPALFRMEPWAPYAIGQIELPEGLRVMGMLTGCALDDIVIGMEVELTAEPLYRDELGRNVLTYKFKPLHIEKAAA